MEKRFFIKTCLILVLTALLIPVTSLARERMGENPNEITIAAVGDLLIHTDVLFTAQEHNELSQESKVSLNNSGFDYLFREIASELSAADITLANLECPVTPAHENDPYHLKDSRSMVFNTPPAFVDAAMKAGIDVFSLANNHAYDQGVEGLKTTMAQMKDMGADFVGAGEKANLARNALVITTKRGVKIGFIAYTQVFNNNLNSSDVTAPKVNQLITDEDMLYALHDIKTARAQCDFLVAMIHWGSEYKYYEPSEIQVLTARKFLEGGVDVIFGHHPHVLQKAEWYQTEDGRKTLVAYSLGNFISNQSRKYEPRDGDTEDAYTRDGVIMEITIENNAQLTKKTNIAIKKFRVIPVWTVNNWHEWTYNGNCGDPIHSWDPKCWETWRNNEKRGKREIYTIPLEKKVAELQDKLSTLKTDTRESQDIMLELDLYKARYKIISELFKDL